MKPPFNFVSGTHLRLIAIDGMIQQWHRKVMTDEQAMRAIRAYVLLEDEADDAAV